MQNVAIEYELHTKSGTYSAKSVVTSYGLREWVTRSLPSDIALGGGRVTVDESVTSLNIPVTTVSGRWSDTVTSRVDVSNNSLVSESILTALSAEMGKSITITELGIQDSGGLWTYALIYDVAGNSSAITIDKGEFLRISVKIRVEYKATDREVPISIGAARGHKLVGSNRAANMTFYRTEREVELGVSPPTNGTGIQSFKTAEVTVKDGKFIYLVPQENGNGVDPILGMLWEPEGTSIKVFFKDLVIIKNPTDVLEVAVNLNLKNSE